MQPVGAEPVVGEDAKERRIHQGVDDLRFELVHGRSSSQADETE
jgi:hypothetical protein